MCLNRVLLLWTCLSFYVVVYLFFFFYIILCGLYATKKKWIKIVSIDWRFSLRLFVSVLSSLWDIIYNNSRFFYWTRSNISQQSIDRYFQYANDILISFFSFLSLTTSFVVEEDDDHPFSLMILFLFLLLFLCCCIDWFLLLIFIDNYT